VLDISPECYRRRVRGVGDVSDFLDLEAVMLFQISLELFS